MWKTFFTICDSLCCLIPMRGLRHKMRREQLFDWRRKYNALRAAYPELNFRRTRMIKGGWNIGFIVDNKYVFKIRKNIHSSKTERIMREKRITDAFAKISPLRIPKIEIINIGEYTFFKYDFMPGKNLNSFSLRTIMQHRDAWGAQLAEFICAVHNARPGEIDDLKTKNGDGWNHNDICNNIIVDKKTMKIIGLIDWEYSGWGTLETELANTDRFSTNMQRAQMSDAVREQYNQICKK